MCECMPVGTMSVLKISSRILLNLPTFLNLYHASYEQLIGQTGPSSSFFPFYYVTLHLLNRRSITWMLLLLVPIAAALCDVTGKVFGNMYFPTQTQIHMEIASEDNARSKKKKGDTKEKAN
mmetsp:Transcript_25487/g.38173  ORF Transcript_25487/g.38173 Transcript_25487/m.38173 type:complete len:121 (+) Transcript_25487:328-690(+)